MESYYDLKRKYDELHAKYERAKNMRSQLLVLIGAFVFMVSGFLHFQNTIIFEVGILVFSIGFSYEYIGTKVGWWSYTGSPLRMVFGRIPLELILAYFFVGGSAAVIALFLIRGAEMASLLIYFVLGIFAALVALAAVFLLKGL